RGHKQNQLRGGCQTTSGARVGARPGRRTEGCRESAGATTLPSASWSKLLVLHSCPFSQTDPNASGSQQSCSDVASSEAASLDAMADGLMACPVSNVMVWAIPLTGSTRIISRTISTFRHVIIGSGFLESETGCSRFRPSFSPSR
ncbi:MAG: hypothetical protein ACJAST_004211, partial [Halopseudomonas sp.]